MQKMKFIVVIVPTKYGFRSATFQTRELNETWYVSHVYIKDFVHVFRYSSFVLRLLLCVMCEPVYIITALLLVLSNGILN